MALLPIQEYAWLIVTGARNDSGDLPIVSFSAEFQHALFSEGQHSTGRHPFNCAQFKFLLADSSPQSNIKTCDGRSHLNIAKKPRGRGPYADDSGCLAKVGVH